MLRHGDRDRGSDCPRLTPADEGKRVVTAGGETVGTVARADGAAALVRPREGLLDGCGSWLSSPWCDSGPFELDARAVVRVKTLVQQLRHKYEDRLDEGTLDRSWSSVTELSQLIATQRPGRSGSNGSTLS